jgi:hypothetical protein
MPNISIACICGRTYSVDAGLAGTAITCPTCGKQLSVPAVDLPLAETLPHTPSPKPISDRLPVAEAPRGRKKKVPTFLWVGLAILSVIVVAVGGPYGIQRYHEWRLNQTTQTWNQLPHDQQARQQSLEREVRGKHLVLTVTGPRSIQAGASNRYLIESRSLENEPAKANLVLAVRDKTGKPIVPETKVESSGKFQFTVPMPAAVRPNDEWTLEISATREGDSGKPVTVRESLPLERPVYLTHLVTDKPLYQPGQVLSFRSLTLQRFSLQPPEEDLQLLFTITDPSGAVVFRHAGSAQLLAGDKESRLVTGPDNKAIRGIGVGEFAIPPSAAGGEYSLRVTELGDRFPPATRKFLINRYQPPRLHKELEFTRASYGPGDEVHAAARVVRIEGGKPLAGISATATVIVDGKRLTADGTPKDDATISLQTDANGAVALRFRLPKEIDAGEASLSLQFNDGANVETMIRPIPIVVRRLRIDAYPEGGELVAGLPNRVYFEVRTPLGKPADIVGRLVDSKGQTVVAIRTLTDPSTSGVNRGLGRFEFTPQAGQEYKIVVDSPAGLKLSFPLPPVKSDGVTLQVDSGVTNDAQPIRVSVGSAGANRKLVVAIYCRGRLVGSESRDVKSGTKSDITVMPEAGVGGVLRVTAFDERGTELRPVAERLVYRRSAQRLNVALTTEKANYTPGDKVRLQIVTTDETLKPAPGIALVSVIDRAALSLADDKTIHGMPAQFLLTNEVSKPEDLEHADFLLSDHPQAPIAVDLLLGTQGWRRFAEQNPSEFRERNPGEGQRLIALAGAAPVVISNIAIIERSAAPQLAEARRQALNEFGERRRLLASQREEHRDLAQKWKSRTEDFAIAGGLAMGLLVVIGGLAAVIAVIDRRLVETRVAVASVFAFMVVAVVFAVVGLRQWSSPSWKSNDAYRQDGVFPPPKTAEASVATPAPGGMGRAGPGGPSPDAAMATRPDQGRVDLPAAPPGVDGGDFKGSRDEEVWFGKKVETERRGDSTLPNDRRDDSGFTTGLSKADPAASARRRYANARANAGRATGAGPGGAVTPGTLSFEQVDRSNRSRIDTNSQRPFIVREYAHQNTSDRTGTRADFTEVVYWHPVLVLPNGDATVSFDLSDSISSFRALAYVHTTDGRLGAAELVFGSRLPFSIQAKLPLELSSGDEVHLPVSVANDTKTNRAVRLQVDARGMTLMGGEREAKLDLPAEQRSRRTFKFKPAANRGDARIVITGTGDALQDRVEQTLQIVPEGFPVVGARSGTAKGELTAKFELPAKWTPGSLKLRGEVYPSVMADIVSGIEGMLREPTGCFEQTSSSSYPNLLILDYLQQTNQARPDVTRRAMDLLARGYRRLLTFECQSPSGQREGFEWFGHYPPHEALTAYGLVQFHDLAKVYPGVDPQLIERTRKFLLSRRDGTGNFMRRQDHHAFGRVSQQTFNAYLCWALTESEVDADLNKEMSRLIEDAKTVDDPYFLALTAKALLNRNERAEAEKILARLAKLQTADGSLPGRESIVGSYGREPAIEATSLAIVAWLKAPDALIYREPIAKASRWLTLQRSPYGSFGSTQATILTLRALTQLAKDSKKLTPGDVILSINGNPVLRTAFASTSQDTLRLELPDAEKLLRPGANEVRLEVTGGAELPAKISWQYHTLQPPTAPNAPVTLATKLDKEKLAEGDTVRLTATVVNNTGSDTSMAVAIIGLPAGLSLPDDLKQLQELAKPRTPLAGRDIPEPGVISFFEVRGREVVLYWRGLEKGQRVEVPIDLICRVPGSYRGPASRAYLYYGAESKSWTAPLTAVIAAK